MLCCFCVSNKKKLHLVHWSVQNNDIASSVLSYFRCVINSLHITSSLNPKIYLTNFAKYPERKRLYLGKVLISYGSSIVHISISPPPSPTNHPFHIPFCIKAWDKVDNLYMRILNLFSMSRPSDSHGNKRICFQ